MCRKLLVVNLSSSDTFPVMLFSLKCFIKNVRLFWLLWAFIGYLIEPYSIHGSFLKLEYLKTEFNEDNGTYAIVKVTSHSCRIMVNLSISDNFEVMRHP